MSTKSTAATAVVAQSATPLSIILESAIAAAVEQAIAKYLQKGGAR